MAIEIDKMFSINTESLKHSLDILIDQRLNFRPITREKYIQLVKVDLSDLPFDGTIKERNEFIEITLNSIIDDYKDNNKIVLLDEAPSIKVSSQEDLSEAINNAKEGDIINVDKNVNITNSLDIKTDNVTINVNSNTIEGEVNIIGNNVTLKDANISAKTVITGENAILDNIKINNFDTEVTENKGKGTALVKVVSNGDLTIRNTNLENVQGLAYNAINIDVKGKIIIENCTFGEITGVYNGIEFSQKTPIKELVIKNNIFKKGSCTHNSINLFTFEDNANVTIENNIFEYSANAIRLSNYTNSNVIFNITNNKMLDGDTSDWGGLICFQAVKENESFVGFTINVKDLIGTDGNIIKTVEGTGTGINRLGYYYGDKYENHIVPDDAKATVNFID